MVTSVAVAGQDTTPSPSLADAAEIPAPLLRVAPSSLVSARSANVTSPLHYLYFIVCNV